LLIGRSAPVEEEKERHRKDFQRNLKNPLTNRPQDAIMITKRGEGKPHKPERK
jgi:hypothetical protein